jgi:hypothetical protein
MFREFDVDIRAQTHVIGEIPAWMIWVIIKHDVIRIPHPIAAVRDVVRSDGEKPAFNGKPRWAAAMNSPDVVSPHNTREVAALPGMVEMVMRIIAAAIMSDPAVIFGVDVRRFRVPLHVVKLAVFVSCGCAVSRHAHRRGCRAMCRDVSASNSVLPRTIRRGATAMLWVDRNRKQ